MESLLARNASVRHLVAASGLSQLGTQISLIAMPLLALGSLDASTFEVSLLGLSEFLPFVLFGLPAGAFIDQRWRRRVMLQTDLVRAALLLTIPVAHVWWHVTLAQLYLVAFAVGAMTVFFDVAAQSFVPNVVEPVDLGSAYSAYSVAESVAGTAGPSIGGLAVRALTAPFAIGLDAISYAGSALLVSRIDRLTEWRKRDPADQRDPFVEQIREGWRFVFTHPHLRPIALCIGTANLFATMLQAVFVTFLVRERGMGAIRVGLIFAVGNLGIALGALLASRIRRHLRLGQILWMFSLLAGLGQVLLAVAPRSQPLPVLIAGWFVSAFASTVYNIQQVTFRQAVTPEAIRGRMNATVRFMIWGTIPVGFLVGGFAGTHLGLHATISVAAAGAMTCFLWTLLSPVRSLIGIPLPAPTGQPRDLTR